MDIPLAPQRSRNPEGFQSPSGQISKAAFFRARSNQTNNRTSYIENETSEIRNPTETVRTSDAASGLQNRSDTSRQAVQDTHLGTMSPPATQGHSPATTHEHHTGSFSHDKPMPADLSRTRTARYRSGDLRTEATYIASPITESSSALHRSSSRASSRVGQVKRIETIVRSSRQGSSSQMSGESADLLMSLMAGQAAMDSQNMPISNWEQVEEWKKIVEEKAARFEKEAGEVKELRVVAQRVQQQDKQLKNYFNQIQQLESAFTEVSAKERILLRKVEELELEKERLQNHSALLSQEIEVLRKETVASKRQEDTWSQAMPILARALNVPQSSNLAEMADTANRLRSTVARKEEELNVAREEMREVSMGMEKELSRVATDKDAYKARIEELEHGIGESKRSMGPRTVDLEVSLKVRRRQVQDGLWFNLILHVQQQADKIESLESENAEMHAALATAENQAWNRAATSSSNEDSTRLKALRTEMEAQDVLMEELWTILPSPASRRATGLVDAVTDQLKFEVSSPGLECRPEALRGLFSPAPPTRQEDFAGVQETVRRVKTLIEDSKLIVERTVQAEKERELHKHNAARATLLMEKHNASLTTYQRQVNILEAKLKQAKEDGKQAHPDHSVLERKIHDAEEAKHKSEQNLARLQKTCQQLKEANDKLSQRALDVSGEIEREKRKIQSQYQNEIEDLRRQLRDGDEDMERVRIHEQTQRIQLLDELNSAQERIDKLTMQQIAREAKGSNENNADEWGEFLHLPGQKFHDFSKIRDEIVRDTEKMTGKNAGISPNPINLRIFSPNVLTLTLVDLPGLTKVPVGDQPRDIERQIKDMLLKYISKPNAIILAVTAANTDLANSDGLKLARDVDPEGTRTIGVLTKVDLMDQGTDVVDILAGRIIPLRLGYVPVVNRGQRDIDQSKTISSALENERNFFENHSSYASKAQYCGTPYLARKLNVILMHHIRATLPDIKSRIAQQLAKYSAELKALGGAMGETNPGSVVLSTITEFCSEFRTTIDGNTNDLSLNELSGGARISFVFHELFNNGVKGIDPFDQVKDGDIRTILYNSSGSTPSLFVGTTAFEVIVKQQIRRLEDPSIKCCQLVYDELIRILGQLLVKTTSFKRYPELRDRFNSVVINFFKESMVPTQKLVSDMVAMQACYVNTTHPDFLNGHKAMQIVQDRLNANKPPEKAIDPKSGKLAPGALNNGRDLDADFKKEEPSFFGSFFHKDKTPKRKGTPIMEAPPAVIKPVASLNEREIMETEVIKLLIMSYFSVVKREMIDMVPKAITLTLVNYAKENLQRVLLEHLYKPEILDELLKESPDIVTRRKECIKMVGALNQAEAMYVH
ncbi:hypothetical protein QFC19_008270 [Naganishia cerealis]|uniref:Uncharacterized protein n=1 Tax=Naganishia cerealis TaxID=610337 RepID=A0ACC2V3D8_9TREE|nr:hypothetical protein QFC19_008270 [Naganishia cerealis]